MCAPSTSGTTRSHLVVSTTMEARLLSKSTKAAFTIGSITTAELTSVNGFSAQWRESGLCRVQVVPDRMGVTIQPIIQQWLLPGTHIMSDGWPAYHNLDQFNDGVYLHDVVIHEQNFVDPLHPEIRTQNEDNIWMRAKRKLRRQFGTARPLFVTYLKCILTVNFAQRSPEDTKRLLSEPSTLSQKSCYIGYERCLGLNNSLVDINITKISR